jgi:hypothetical protein
MKIRGPIVMNTEECDTISETIMELMPSIFELGKYGST